MRLVSTLAGVFAGLASAGFAGGQTPPPSAPAAAPATPPPQGYLSGHEPDIVAVIPQAPTPGSTRDLADRTIFKELRSMKGSPRWALAHDDAVLTASAVLKDFSCAAGISLDQTNASALLDVLRRLSADLGVAYNAPKDLYKRRRPYIRDPGEICLDRSKALDESYDYPSGHAFFAWTYGLILAELLPDRAGPILQRARAFGESRAVCGVHSASAVTEARTGAAALVAALHSSPAFRADMDAARAQLARVAAPGAPAPAPETCRAESGLTARTPW
jgi:acid phosphatase (class A)